MSYFILRYLMSTQRHNCTTSFQCIYAYLHRKKAADFNLICINFCRASFTSLFFHPLSSILCTSLEHFVCVFTFSLSLFLFPASVFTRKKGKGVLHESLLLIHFSLFHFNNHSTQCKLKSLSLSSFSRFM